MRSGSLLLSFALVIFFPLPSDQIGGGFLVCYFFLSFSCFICFFGCSDGMEREACVCDHGFERSDLCAEIIIIIIIIINPRKQPLRTDTIRTSETNLASFYNLIQ